MSKISIIIPCFNYGRYLPEAIQSVLEQTYQDFEIIVVDDGSTDLETKRIIAGISHPKIRVITQENKGLPATRNTGIREARGEYIVPLDADDKLAPTYLEKCMWMMERNPSLDFVYTAAQTFGDYEYLWFEEYDAKELLKRNFITATALYRKKDWEKVGGYDESFVAYEDWDFWLRFLKNDIFGALLPEPLFLYRKHRPSMLNEIGEPHRHEIEAAIKELHRELYKQTEHISSHHFSGVLPSETLSYVTHKLRKDQDELRDISVAFQRLKGESSREIDHVRTELRGKQEELEHIYTSRGWKILSFLHRLRLKVPFLKNL
ncbi:MAG: glycosyltransferase family A protein [Patescibacteria group bacterium]